MLVRFSRAESKRFSPQRLINLEIVIVNAGATGLELRYCSSVFVVEFDLVRNIFAAISMEGVCFLPILRFAVGRTCRFFSSFRFENPLESSISYAILHAVYDDPHTVTQIVNHNLAIESLI